MSIPFTQYVLPNGEARQGAFSRPEDVEDLARKLLEDGWEFSAEMLRTGEIVLYVERDEDVQLLEVVPNGPPVVEAVDRLIREAAALTPDAVMRMVEGGR